MKKMLSVLVVVVLMGVPLGGCSQDVSKEDIFLKVVEEVTNPEICEVASDGSYLKVDTNPNNEDGYYNADYMQTVMDINTALGFSESLYEKMLQTRALDGRLSDSNDDFNVSWSYHPNRGMVALYEKK